MRKKYVIYFIILIAFAFMGVGGMIVWKNYVSMDNSRLVVLPNRDIGNYEVIKKENLTTVKVDGNTDLSAYAITEEELVGKVAKINLFEKTPVPKRALGEEENLQDIVFVTINTSYTKAGGAKVGDRVDVDYIATDVANNVLGLVKKELVKDAKVVSVTDTNGNPSYKAGISTPVSVGSQSPVQAVRLAIKPAEKSPELIYGAISTDNGLVLTVKFKDKPVEVAKPLNILEQPEAAPEYPSVAEPQAQ